MREPSSLLGRSRTSRELGARRSRRGTAATAVGSGFVHNGTTLTADTPPWTLARLWAPDGLGAALEEVTSRVQRPAVLTFTSATLGAVVHSWLVAAPARPVAVLNGRHVNDALVAGFADRVDALRRMDDVLGGEDVHGLAVSELRVIVRLLRTGAYSQDQRARLYAVAAELARLAGWAAFDSGRHQIAQQFWLVALRTAHEAGDRAIGANILRCMAEQAVRYGDPADAVTMLRAARAGAGDALTATEKAVLAGSLAIAHAQVGDSRAVRAEIAEAFTQIDQAEPGDDPDYVYWCSRPTIEYYAGKALLCIGDAAAAIGHLRRSVDELDACEYPRELIHHRVWLGVAQVDAGEVERAVDLGYQAIDLAGCVASENARVDVLTLCGAIEIAGHPGAAALAEHARTALRSGDRAPVGV
ncbi:MULTISPECIES: XRE family transcriptional regulator [unclassified Frankia]|uniref:XRE family transcriptional regulator n=1 Tax=unclassified Frankia TaxID=2632575 RepID=UPI002AD41BBF|nr:MULTISPECIES: XRE family transcriptional regulator [unclassified Frankia]